MHFIDSHNIFMFLLQLFVILILSKFAVSLFRKWKQPAITFELMIGLILGPTVLGKYFPEIQSWLFPADLVQQNMLETVSWLGVLFLLLDVGLEIDFSVAWKQRGKALIISVTDIIIPMIVAFFPCYFLISDIFIVDPSQRVIFSLFLSVVMTISAMPVAARIMHDLNLLKTELGFLTMSALAINDIIGWVLFTIILGLFTSSSIEFGNIAVILVSTIGFAAFALTFGRTLSTKIVESFQKKGFPEPAASFSFMCLTGLLFGAITEFIGIHALFGFFIAGIVIGEAKTLNENSRNIISQMVHAFFVPVFFVNIGLKLDFIADFNIFLVLLITVIGIAGRYYGAWLGVTFTKVSKVNKDLIAIAHTPGGMMEIVVAFIAYEGGLITAPIFIAIVFGAIFSSIIMGPWMKRAMSKRKDIRITDYINGRSIIPNMLSLTRNSAIRELSNVLSGKLKPDQVEIIADLALRREEDFGTALGRNVAIPHARTDLIQDPVLIFGRSRYGIEWNAPDGQHVHFIFFLVTPKDIKDIHVQILSKIARIISSKENRLVLDNIENDGDLWPALKKMLGEIK
jgi:Kef-type K+ transport system membrane component KefB/mannitol/fructose-specific phosphotransferase system IIA component (Ntr-type)